MQKANAEQAAKSVGRAVSCRIRKSDGCCQKNEIAMRATVAKIQNAPKKSNGPWKALRGLFSVGSVPLMTVGATQVA